MPGASASRPVLSAGANYQAEDWASAAGSAQLDLRASAELTRGVDLEVGAEALIGLDASVSKFLALDVQGHANAAAAVRAQVQVPIDLFDEAGVAIRLQAIAEAAAGIQLGIGLDVGDFIALAQSDPRMKGVALRLLTVFLEEAQIQGGVMAKAAAAAMAYVNVAATGRLIETAAGEAGFTVVAEAGVGLKAGAGFRVFGTFGLNDPSRLIRRTVDVVVDDTVQRITERAADPAVRAMIAELRAPAKIALRTCFELGAELARGGGAFSAAQAPVVAQRCLQVFFEEVQRHVLELVTQAAIDLYAEALRAIGLSEPVWNGAQGERLQFAQRLRAVPSDPFEPTATNQEYWTGLIGDASALAIALGGGNQHDKEWVEPVAQAWAASQLLFAAVGRITDSGARATVLNASADTAFPPFTGAALQRPPDVIRARISETVRPGALPRDPTLDDLVAFLVRGAVVDPLVARHPDLALVFTLVSGGGASHLAAMTTLMTNLGAFVAQSGNRVDPQASLQLVMSGLRGWFTDRLRNDIEPVLQDVLGGDIPEVRLYLDEVLLASIGFAVDVIFPRAAAWASGDAGGHKALREACSALLMKLLGRTLVVTTDVLMNKALETVGAAFRDASRELTQANGVVDKLDALIPALDHQTIEEAVTEIFELAADVFEPLPPAKRARIRELLYEIIDTAPARPDASFVDALRQESLVPNGEAATALAIELGTLIGENFTRLVMRLLELLASAVLNAIDALVDAIERQITQWIAALQRLAGELGAFLVSVLAEIEELRQQAALAADRLFDEADKFLGAASGARRIKDGLRDEVRDTCLGVLSAIPGYNDLPREAKRAVKRALDNVLDDVLDDELFDGLTDALAGVAGEVQDFLRDAREIDPNDDVAGALVELLVDRLEDALRDEFGSRISIPIEIRIRNPVNVTFDLGTVRVDVDDVVRVVRRVARDLQAITSAAHDVGQALTQYLSIERLLDLREVEEADARTRRDQANKRIRETQATGGARILQPGAAAAYGGDVPVEIALTNVPRSFLGTDEDELPRVLVLLDETPLDLSRFDITEAGPPGVGFVAVSSLLGAVPLGNAGTIDGAAASLGRLTGSSAQPHPTMRGRAQAALARRARTWHAVDDRTPRTRSIESTKATRGRSVRVGGRSTSQSSTPAATPGRKPRPSITDHLVADSGATLILRGTLRANELVEGFHALTVVLTTGDQRTRQSEAVVFHASPAAVVARPPIFTRPPVGSLPPRPIIPVEHLAPALREVAARGGGRRAHVGPNGITPPLSRARLASPAVSRSIELHRTATAQRFAQRMERIDTIRRGVVERPLMCPVEAAPAAPADVTDRLNEKGDPA